LVLPYGRIRGFRALDFRAPGEPVWSHGIEAAPAAWLVPSAEAGRDSGLAAGRGLGDMEWPPSRLAGRGHPPGSVAVVEPGVGDAAAGPDRVGRAVGRPRGDTAVARHHRAGLDARLVAGGRGGPANVAGCGAHGHMALAWGRPDSGTVLMVTIRT